VNLCASVDISLREMTPFAQREAIFNEFDATSVLRRDDSARQFCHPATEFRRENSA
jgi:hypothetical protein